jgi:hypothetical protein
LFPKLFSPSLPLLLLVLPRLQLSVLLFLIPFLFILPPLPSLPPPLPTCSCPPPTPPVCPPPFALCASLVLPLRLPLPMFPPQQLCFVELDPRPHQHLLHCHQHADPHRY